MRQVLRVLAAAAAGLALLSCNRPPRPQEVVYAPPPPPSYGSASDGGVYVPPAPAADLWQRFLWTSGRSATISAAAELRQRPLWTSGRPATVSRDAELRQRRGPATAPADAELWQRSLWTSGHAGSDQRLVWKSSPRWATAKPKAKTSVVKRDPQAKFKAAQAKAAEVGVENLTKEDIDGLNLAEIKQLRGY